MRFAKIALLLLGITRSLSLADDAYRQVPLSLLTFSEGRLPTNLQWSASASKMAEALQPYVALDTGGEAFVGGEMLRAWANADMAYLNTFLAVRAQKGTVIKGRLFVPRADLSGMVMLRFSLAMEEDAESPSASGPGAAATRTDRRQEFFRAKRNYYRRLRERRLPGAAWFRHQEEEAAHALGADESPREANPLKLRPWRSWDNGYDSAYNLFGGGRDLGEAMPLEGLLTPGGPKPELLASNTLSGIPVSDTNWKALLRDPGPSHDPLAENIPFDQHALFSPGLEAMYRCLQEASHDGTAILQMFGGRSEDINSLGRYEKQLCLDVKDLRHLARSNLITSVAVTGSDLSLASGTDIAVLYETRSPQALQTLLEGKHVAAGQANHAVKRVNGEIEGVAYTGAVSPDRSVSSFVAAVETCVLVSNSRAQLERLISTAKGKTAALSSEDDYRYFRQKYSRDKSAETVFLVLPDAAIRRWCSPRWRIACSRRIRAAAALAELQATHLDELISGTAKPRCVASNLFQVGDIFLTARGVVSPAFGTLDFMTPIIELPFTQVTQTEADAYTRWRAAYQRNWSRVFHPIAVRFSIQPQNYTVEACTTPLISGAECGQFIAASSGASITSNSGDPHPEALVHLALAVNPQSEPIRELGNLLSSFGPNLKANPLGWLGQCVAVYADHDEFWAELAGASKGSAFLEKNYPRLPVAVYCEVRDPLGLIVFLAAARAFTEQKAQGLCRWENLEYNGKTYVKIALSQRLGTDAAANNLCIYYAITPNSLVASLSEPVLKRAIDRRARSGSEPSSNHSTAGAELPPNPWLGSNVCLRFDRKFAPVIEALLRDEVRAVRQRLAWSNLPILNEWKHRYPRNDPVELGEQFWHTRLVSPVDGLYEWNEQWQTMESSVYGCPARPKSGPDEILPVENIGSANLGLTLENECLSVKLVLDRPEAQPAH